MYYFLRYDTRTNNSRIDFYNGLAKTYQLGEHGFGTSLKVVPFTTEEVLNKITCFQVNGTEDDPVTPQAILPSLDDFTFAGNIDTNIVDNYRLKNNCNK